MKRVLLRSLAACLLCAASTSTWALGVDVLFLDLDARTNFKPSGMATVFNNSSPSEVFVTTEAFAASVSPTGELSNTPTTALDIRPKFGRIKPGETFRFKITYGGPVPEAEQHYRVLFKGLSVPSELSVSPQAAANEGISTALSTSIGFTIPVYVADSSRLKFAHADFSAALCPSTDAQISPVSLCLDNKANMRVNVAMKALGSPSEAVNLGVVYAQSNRRFSHPMLRPGSAYEITVTAAGTQHVYTAR